MTTIPLMMEDKSSSPEGALFFVKEFCSREKSESEGNSFFSRVMIFRNNERKQKEQRNNRKKGYGPINSLGNSRKTLLHVQA
jgi:hypothetical protein